MLRIVARLSARARATPRRSPCSSVIPALSHRHVRTGAHGDSHVCLRQRRRVIHSVAGHGHHVPFALQLLYHFNLLARQNSGEDFVYPQFARDDFRSRATIARKHHHLHPIFVQPVNRFRRGGFDRISHANQSHSVPFSANKHGRLAVRFYLPRLVL